MVERLARVWCRLAHFKEWRDDSRLNPRAQEIVTITRLRCGRCLRVHQVGVRVHAVHPGVAVLRIP